jgi:hypothetical protein
MIITHLLSIEFIFCPSIIIYEIYEELKVIGKKLVTFIIILTSLLILNIKIDTTIAQVTGVIVDPSLIEFHTNATGQQFTIAVKIVNVVISTASIYNSNGIQNTLNMLAAPSACQKTTIQTAFYINQYCQ